MTVQVVIVIVVTGVEIFNQHPHQQKSPMSIKYTMSARESEDFGRDYSTSKAPFPATIRPEHPAPMLSLDAEA